jgi:hypothetical protein
LFENKTMGRVIKTFTIVISTIPWCYKAILHK